MGWRAGSGRWAKQRNSLKKLAHAINLVPMVPHRVVRRLVMGEKPEDVMRSATPEQLVRMQALVRQGMGEGASGSRPELECDPRYSTTEEWMAQVRPDASRCLAVPPVHDSAVDHNGGS
jgi:hypothetical protein